MFTYRVFLDDMRDVKMIYPKMEDSDFSIVRNYNDFLSLIKEKGLPEFISFDNDLGEDEHGNLLPDGYAVAKWLVYESDIDISDLTFNVHSANPVAKVQIQSLINNYIKFLKSEKEAK